MLFVGLIVDMNAQHGVYRYLYALLSLFHTLLLLLLHSVNLLLPTAMRFQLHSFSHYIQYSISTKTAENAVIHFTAIAHDENVSDKNNQKMIEFN